MIRRAFTMRLKPDAFDEYKRHHDEIWPDLVAEIERSGIAQITTFRRGLDLFLFSQIADLEAWNRLWTSEVHRRWAQVMEPLMHLRDDGIVDAGELTEIFHLATPVGQPAPAAPHSARAQSAKPQTAKPPRRKPAAKAAKAKAKPAPAKKAPKAKKAVKKAAGKATAKPAAKKSAKKPKPAKRKGKH